MPRLRHGSQAVDPLARLARLAPHSVRLVVLDDFHVVQLPGGRAYPEHLCVFRASGISGFGQAPERLLRPLIATTRRALLPGPEGSPEQAARCLQELVTTWAVATEGV